MKIATINKLCCPFDKKDLKLTIITKDVEENILEGFLTCKSCNRIYPMVKGIPIMNPDEYREFKLEQPLLEKYQSHLKGKKIENFRLLPNDEETKEIE
ncbi:Trm112 family protein [Salegentibacter sp. F188]|uniref:Trm112 family protein n=1 Tax=Autumnicola patrickiae TaxID=3075591 RepID=A0ABU3E4R8_9FLAO|nr:Trm112 family protein [Salegentibacter sp. F188]MDT0690976.1 Trm112 family protein [Salegentibacter sp. F188]